MTEPEPEKKIYIYLSRGADGNKKDYKWYPSQIRDTINNLATNVVFAKELRGFVNYIVIPDEAKPLKNKPSGTETKHLSEFLFLLAQRAAEKKSVGRRPILDKQKVRYLHEM